MLLAGLIFSGCTKINEYPGADTITPGNALSKYLNNADATYYWEVQKSYNILDVTAYDLLLTSQQWREYTWKHQLSNDITTMLDPYSYRNKLTMPKMIIIGTNDPYWPVDAVKHYFNDLPGENYLHYVANAGHDLNGGQQALRCVSAFFSILFSLFSCNKSEKFEGFVTTAGTCTDKIKVAVVQGTPYEMGSQLGNLLKDDIDSCLFDFLSYAQEEAPDIYSNEQLDQAWETNAPHIDFRVIEEMKGMADASGIDLKMIQRSHMIPVISSYACSGAAVWGEGTKNNHTYQIRNLDFTMGADLQDHPLIVIYIPDDGTPHMNVTFAGYIGSHTGMNANHMVFGEKGESPMSEYPYDVNGVHFSFLFRSLMYDSKSLYDVNKFQYIKL